MKERLLQDDYFGYCYTEYSSPEEFASNKEQRIRDLAEMRQEGLYMAFFEFCSLSRSQRAAKLLARIHEVRPAKGALQEASFTIHDSNNEPFMNVHGSYEDGLLQFPYLGRTVEAIAKWEPIKGGFLIGYEPAGIEREFRETEAKGIGQGAVIRRLVEKDTGVFGA